MNNSNFQPSHDYEQPNGVMGDKAVAEGVCMNVTTGNNSNKKRRSNKKKKDNAEGLGGNEILAMDVGNGGDNANRKTTDNAEVVLGDNKIHAAVHGGNGGIDEVLGCNEGHAAMDGGNGGIDAPVDFFGIFNDEEVDGINQGSADDHIVNNTSVTVIKRESKKEIVLVSKDVLKKMIQLLMKEDMSDNAPVNLLCNLVPYEEYCFISLEN